MQEYTVIIPNVLTTFCFNVISGIISTLYHKGINLDLYADADFMPYNFN